MLESLPNLPGLGRATPAGAVGLGLEVRWAGSGPAAGGTGRQQETGLHQEVHLCVSRMFPLQGLPWWCSG